MCFPKKIRKIAIKFKKKNWKGQNPARQSALKAGIPESVPCTTINKVCSSGMKSISLAVSTILDSQRKNMNKINNDRIDCIMTGGMESMSNVPYYNNNIRINHSVKMGNANVIDGMLKDGLTDAYNQKHMGFAAELCADKYQISRQQQVYFFVLFCIFLLHCVCVLSREGVF